ncbi:MAG: hypothetical protein AB7G75_05175 [Candidatus Binatia bacterium]
MSVSLNELAERIVALEPTEQEALIEKVAELNFQRGLAALSQTYRKRLTQAGKLDQSVAEVLAELAKVREEIAAHDYRV